MSFRQKLVQVVVPILLMAGAMPYTANAAAVPAAHPSGPNAACTRTTGNGGAGTVTLGGKMYSTTGLHHTSGKCNGVWVTSYDPSDNQSSEFYLEHLTGPHSYTLIGPLVITAYQSTWVQMWSSTASDQSYYLLRYVGPGNQCNYYPEIAVYCIAPYDYSIFIAE